MQAALPGPNSFILQRLCIQPWQCGLGPDHESAAQVRVWDVRKTGCLEVCDQHASYTPATLRCALLQDPQAAPY